MATKQKTSNGNKGGKGGGTGKGSTKSVAERQAASDAVKDHDRAVAKQKAKARSDLGPAWFVEQNANKSSDKESFTAGMPQPYAFPGGDQPSVHLEHSFVPSRDGTKRELVVMYHSAHDGHPLKGLSKGKHIKAKWLANAGFKSTAPNPSVKKTQDAVIGYLWDFFGGPITVQNAVVDIEKDDTPNTKATSNTAPAEQSADVVTEFTLENEMVTDKGKTGQISFTVKAGKVVITMFRSAKYGGKDWGFAPQNAYLHMPNGSNRCLWDLYAQDKELGLFFNLIQTADDGFIVVGTKGKGNEKTLFTAVSLKSEAEKVEVVGANNTLTLMGGMNLLGMVAFKAKLAKLKPLGISSVRFTDEEMDMKRKLDGHKSKISAEKKKAEDFLKVKKAGERQAALMKDIEDRPIVVYNRRGEDITLLDVGNEHTALLFGPGNHVLLRDKKTGAPIHKVVRGSGQNKYLAKDEDVTFERPMFEGKARVLEVKEAVRINEELGYAEVSVINDRQAAVTLRAQGLNSGAFVAYRDETDDQMVILRVWADKIEEIGRQPELDSL